MTNKIRKPCVAGKFYPSSAPNLLKSITKFLDIKGVEKTEALAIISPHAGYIFSGAIAGTAFASVELPDNIILIGPNHTGAGKGASVMSSGAWETPLGETQINTELAEKIIASSEIFSKDLEDNSAHASEHSLEVQLPFIQYINENATIVPITLMYDRSAPYKELGKALAQVIKSYKEKILIIVSSDMNHYESEEETIKKDNLAIEKILALDPEGLLSITQEKNISMCGVLPSAVAIECVNTLGATKATLLSHTTSAGVTGDKEETVGYAAILIK
ncbi:MAG: AmmeMemoRadiSam system protein B [Deltaproteobacteria bacterium]|nr:AmmeMemoRadiSam system protein B [Deltaproteobacteria bacterium]